MKLLFIGDVVGAPGRAAVKKHLPDLVRQHHIDFVIANGENSAHGKGITPKIYKELLGYGIDAITLGNHAYAKSEITLFSDQSKLIYPANYRGDFEGVTTRVFQVKGHSLAISNICTQAFMEGVTVDPFIMMERILKKVVADFHFVDLHGEATSEKIAFAHFFKHSCTAICGTHTHVQTADEQILSGCAYITDVGMTGPMESIIGRDIDEILNRLVYHVVTQYTIADNEAIFCGVVIDIDEIEKKAISIQRIQIRPS